MSIVHFPPTFAERLTALMRAAETLAADAAQMTADAKTVDHCLALRKTLAVAEAMLDAQERAALWRADALCTPEPTCLVSARDFEENWK